MVDLDIVLNELSSVETSGVINLYALKYAYRPKDNNFVVSLPSNQNSYFIERYCHFLRAFKGLDCCRFDPVGKKNSDTYEFMPLDGISDVWTDIVSMINTSITLRDSPNRKLLSSVNLTICELEYNGKILWLGTQQQKAESLFKGKHPFFFDTEDKLTLITLDDFIVLSFNVDFIVDFEEKPARVYIFNREKFVAIFNFYDLLKEHVQTKSHIIKEWAFLDNPDYIQREVGTTYVFKGIARIIDDAEYLKQMKVIDPFTLKNRLLEKCSSSFSEEDFEGEKLKVTKSNLKNIIKMISKEFRYNFFADKAEELK
ncbi:MAG: DUF4868 domain-containing protein [Nitrososphaerota archaeon]|nr:DUF4868 domain-containing protein [Nitrososphaerota archaeon]